MGGLDPCKMRLREKLSEKLTVVFDEDKVLSHYQMFDDKEIAIQIVEEPTFQEDSHLVMVKVFDPESWALGAPREVWVQIKANLGDFASILSEQLGIPAENLELTKVNSPWNFHRVTLPFAEWVRIGAEGVKESYMHSAPFYLSTDGILFIAKDSRKEMREMTNAEKDLYRCEDFES